MGTGLLLPANAEDEETPVGVIVVTAVAVVDVGIKLRRLGLRKI